MNHNLSRRRFLRAAGLAVALPALPTLTRATAFASESSAIQPRLCYLYTPNGVNMEHWRVQGEGGDFQFNRSTKSLEPFREQLRFITGLEHREAYIHRDGAGDHARANATFLTAARPHKTAGADIHVGVSVDQVIANKIGGATRLASLELSCDGVRKSGGCDSGYSCAYQFNLAWADARTPVAPESNPRLVFERLFGDGTHGKRRENYLRRQANQQSVLDFLRDEVALVNKQISREDRPKLEEYLTGVREIETRIEKAEQFGVPSDPDYPTPSGVPKKYSEHIRLLMDVMALAFETDSTRVATFLLAHDGSNRSFTEINVNDGHHDLSHHKRDPERLEKIARIDQFYVDQFAYFLDAMNRRRASGGTSLLDQTMIVYGSGLCDGDRHNHDDLPIIVAGGKALGVAGGFHHKLDDKTPMANLHLELMHRMGVPSESFGDATGRLALG